MNALELSKLLAAESHNDHSRLASQLAEHLAKSPVETEATRRSPTYTIRRYTNDDATSLAFAVRDVLGYQMDEYPDDLIRRLEATFGIQFASANCDYINGGALVTPDSRVVFLADDTADRQFHLALEVGRLLILMSNEKDRAISLTCRDWKRPPRRHHFARRFALELLITEPLLARSLVQVRGGLGVVSPTIGDIEIFALSRLFRISFYNTAKRLELLKLLPLGGAESLVEHLNNKFGSVEGRANALGIPADEVP